MVSWTDNKELLSIADAISWNSLLKKKKSYDLKFWIMIFLKVQIKFFFLRTWNLLLVWIEEKERE